MNARMRISLNSGVARHERAQPIAAQFQKLARFGHAPAHQAALPGDHRHLAGEFAGPVRGDRALARRGRAARFPSSRKQHEKGDVRIARLKEHFALHDLPDFAQRPDAIDLRRG